MNEGLIYPDESYRIMGACFSVYKDKRNGYTEPIYQECLAKEFLHLGIAFEEQKELPLTYRGEKLLHTFRVDFVCFDRILLEIKSVSKLTDEHRAQVLNYLHASGLKLALLVNFGHYPQIEYERIVL